MKEVIGNNTLYLIRRYHTYDVILVDNNSGGSLHRSRIYSTAVVLKVLMQYRKIAKNY